MGAFRRIEDVGILGVFLMLLYPPSVRETLHTLYPSASSCLFPASTPDGRYRNPSDRA